VTTRNLHPMKLNKESATSASDRFRNGVLTISLDFEIVWSVPSDVTNCGLTC
jgi:hypothetical protein